MLEVSSAFKCVCIFRGRGSFELFHERGTIIVFDLLILYCRSWFEISHHGGVVWCTISVLPWDMPEKSPSDSKNSEGDWCFPFSCCWETCWSLLLCITIDAMDRYKLFTMWSLCFSCFASTQVLQLYGGLDFTSTQWCWEDAYFFPVWVTFLHSNSGQIV